MQSCKQHTVIDLSHHGQGAQHVGPQVKLEVPYTSHEAATGDEEDGSEHEARGLGLLQHPDRQGEVSQGRALLYRPVHRDVDPFQGGQGQGTMEEEEERDGKEPSTSLEAVWLEAEDGGEPKNLQHYNGHHHLDGEKEHGEVEAVGRQDCFVELVHAKAGEPIEHGGSNDRDIALVPNTVQHREEVYDKKYRSVGFVLDCLYYFRSRPSNKYNNQVTHLNAISQVNYCMTELNRKRHCSPDKFKA